jgi:hypothetical protein
VAGTRTRNSGHSDKLPANEIAQRQVTRCLGNSQNL